MNPLAMKSFNAIELLELLRENEKMSRSSLARLSRLSKPTVSDQVDTLIRRKLVVEAGTAEASARGGKKPTLLEINPDYGRVICVDVGSETTAFACADLRGRISREVRLATLPDQGAQSVLRTIKRGIRTLLRGAPGSRPQVEVISVAVPGIVDVREGVVRETNNVFGWQGIKLGPELASAFGVPVHADNDVNMAALAEWHARRDERLDSFVLIRLDTGVGAGVVLNGRLHHGAHWAAGEIGHMVLDAQAGRRPPGPRGYLESVVGADRVADRLRRTGGLRSMADGAGTLPWSALEQPAKAASQVKKALLDDVVLHLACAVANVVAAYDPEVVILLGEPFPKSLQQITEISRKLVPWDLQIRLSKLGPDAALRGALAAGIGRAFDEITRSLESGEDAGIERAGPLEVGVSI